MESIILLFLIYMLLGAYVGYKKASENICVFKNIPYQMLHFIMCIVWIYIITSPITLILLWNQW